MIKLYTSPTCGKCKILKKWMLDNTISFEEIDIMKDDKIQDILMNQGLMNLPVIQIENDYFNKYEELQKLIKNFTSKI